MNKLNIVAISDTHNRHKQIKELKRINIDGTEVYDVSGDIIFHTGDATSQGRLSEVEDFLKWFGSLDFTYKIFVPGNHDWLFEKNPELGRELCKKHGVILLLHESIEIEGVKIFGSPWTPRFFDWAFNACRTLEEAQHVGMPWIWDKWKDIPSDTNILLTHGPAYGILDATPRGELIGCEWLLNKIKEIKCDIHICGHIHLYGAQQRHIDGTSFYNASICDERYIPINPITKIEYIK